MANEQVSDIHSPEIQDVVVDRDYVMLAGLPIMQFSQIATQKLNGKLESASASFNAVQFNRIGAPTHVFDDENNTRWQTDYSAFGERLNTISTHNDEAKLIRVTQNLPISQSMDDLRYTISIRLPGQNEDPITGLYDNGYRQYDPSVGRYLTPDPMGTVDGLNPYLYVGNNPLNKVDPYGLYQTDMHYYITYFLAITAGIDSDNARRIALATQFVDVNDNTSPLPEGSHWYNYGSIGYNNATTTRLEWYHFVNTRNGVNPTYDYNSWDLAKKPNETETTYRLRRLTANLNQIPQLKIMVKNYKKAANCNNLNLSMQFFGEYLHAFEDTFAHRDANNDPYAINNGTGHASGGENPDFTFNHNENGILGHGSWNNNEARTLIEQASVYAKLLEYRREILKIPDNQTKVISWNTLSPYLQSFNAIRESSNPDLAGSTEPWKTKITYLQNLLNNKYTANVPHGDLPSTSAPNWGYKPKQGGNFELIRFFKDEETGKNALGAGKDGFSVPQAITNRITTLSTLAKNNKYKEYQNVIWETSVKKYESKDGEKGDVVTSVQKYQLKVVKAIPNTIGYESLVILGSPPKGTTK